MDVYPYWGPGVPKNGGYKNLWQELMYWYQNWLVYLSTEIEYYVILCFFFLLCYVMYENVKELPFLRISRLSKMQRDSYFLTSCQSHIPLQ